MNPLLSVIIPTYHRNDLLALCLNCLKQGVQTLDGTQYEVIVSDDGRDTTAQQMLADSYPWVRWIQGPQKGPAANRNRGAQEALGQWLVFTDDDCLPAPNWLSSFYNAIFNYPEELILEGKTISKKGIHSPLYHAPINENGGFLWSCNFAIQKYLFFSIKMFNENFPYPHLEDVEFRDRILEQKLRFKFINDAIVDHPPRRIPFGFTLSKQHESGIFYSRYSKNSVHTGLGLIKNITVTRLKSIMDHKIQMDSFISCLSLAAEIIFVIYKINDWKRKYNVS